MIERETLIRWTEELVAFANGDDDTNPLFTEADIDLEDTAAHALPEEARTPEQTAALRKKARARLAMLARPKWDREVRSKLIHAAERWLEDPLVRSTHDAYSLTPMDGVLSLSESGQLEVAPRFRSPDARFAVTFAELIAPGAPARVKQCCLATCQRFFVYLVGSRGQPRKACCTAHATTARVHKHRRKVK